MLRILATPPSPRTVSSRCSEEVHGKRAEHGKYSSAVSILCTGLGRAPVAHSPPSLSRRLKNEKKDNMATHGCQGNATEPKRKSQPRTIGTKSTTGTDDVTGQTTANSVCWFSRYARYDKNPHYAILRPAKAS